MKKDLRILASIIGMDRNFCFSVLRVLLNIYIIEKQNSINYGGELSLLLLF